ncbi:hypothetical protein HBZS_105490 [Helicobacter bizzozeronii CCUG 35545]|nr:hypothetical protein HBZS_105490 [Helicobacter bizzozeronii CCUG 35545]
MYSEGKDIKIALLEPTLEDTSLILYPPMVHVGDRQIVISNGSQTGAIVQALQEGGVLRGLYEKKLLSLMRPISRPALAHWFAWMGQALAINLA